MIAAWMIYTMAVAFLLYAAAMGAEYVARALRLPTRFTWLFAIAAAVALSGNAMLRGKEAPRQASLASADTPSDTQVDANAGSVTGGSIAMRRPSGSAQIETAPSRFDMIERALVGSISRIDTSALDGWNRTLIVVWIAASLVVASWLLISFRRIHRLAGRLVRQTVGDRSVLVSEDVGPALLGILRTQIVLPRWVLELPPAERDIIIAHEQEHAAAHDPALMCAMMCLVALEPWNVMLWLFLSRMRLAVESDCDRRVLRETGDARAYGELLVAMYERTSGLSPHVAFAERASNLERRIRRITSRPRLFSTAVGASAIAVTVFATAAWKTPAPTRSAPTLTAGSVTKSLAVQPAPAVLPLTVHRHDAPHAPAPRSAPAAAVSVRTVRAETSFVRVTIDSPNQAGYRLVVPRDTTMRPMLLHGRAVINWGTPAGGSDPPYSTMEVVSLDTTAQVHVEAAQNGRVVASGEGSYLVLRRDSVGVAIEAWSHVPTSSPPALGKPSKTAMFIDAETAAVVLPPRVTLPLHVDPLTGQPVPKEGSPTGACAMPDSIAIRGLSRIPDAEVRTALGIAPRTAISGPVVTQALKNLYAIDGVDSIASVTCEMIGGRSVLVFNVTERPGARSVDLAQSRQNFTRAQLLVEIELQRVSAATDPDLVHRFDSEIATVHDSLRSSPGGAAADREAYAGVLVALEARAAAVRSQLRDLRAVYTDEYPAVRHALAEDRAISERLAEIRRHM